MRQFKWYYFNIKKSETERERIDKTRERDNGQEERK